MTNNGIPLGRTIEERSDRPGQAPTPVPVRPTGREAELEDSPECLQSYARQRWRAALDLRSRVGAALIVAGTGVFALATRGLFPVVTLTEALLVAVILATQTCAFVAIPRIVSPLAAQAVALITTAVDCVAVCWLSALDRTTVPAALFVSGLAVSCAALIPWGPRFQALLAVTGVLSLAGNSYGVSGVFPDWSRSPEFLIETMLLAVSIYIARELERTRLEVVSQELALRRTEKNLQALNAHLERRVTERTLALEARTAELENLVGEMRAFSYTVSHDLRAPLRGINGFSQILQEECSEAVGPRGRAYIERVRAATVLMGKMIDSLLALGRVTRTEPSYARVDLSEIARAVAADLRASRPGREIQWKIEDRVVARGDGILLRLVIQNLIENAWKFTMNTEQPCIEFGVRRDCAEPVYYVRDNGIGFDMRYADKLFGAFTRLHGANEFEGMGIGLATVMRAVQRHGGRIWAEAEISQGAAFFFTLG